MDSGCDAVGERIETQVTNDSLGQDDRCCSVGRLGISAARVRCRVRRLCDGDAKGTGRREATAQARPASAQEHCVHCVAEAFQPAVDDRCVSESTILVLEIVQRRLGAPVPRRCDDKVDFVEKRHSAPQDLLPSVVERLNASVRELAAKTFSKSRRLALGRRVSSQNVA